MRTACEQNVKMYLVVLDKGVCLYIFTRSEVACLLSGAAERPALLSCVNLELVMETIIETEASGLAAKRIRVFFLS